MSQGQGGGRIRKAAVPALRLVVEPEPNPTATRLVPPNAPTPPHDLPEAGRLLWDELVGELDRAGLVTRLDGPILHLAIRHYLAAIEASDLLIAEGPIGVGSMGQPVAHPAGAAFRAHTASYNELAKALGLSFAARARISVPDERRDLLDPGNPFSGPPTPV